MPSESSAIAIYPDTSRVEREAFLGRLRNEPQFLLRHLRTLGGALLRRLRTRVVVKFAPTHQGRKVRPSWLGPVIIAGGAARASPAERLRLPTYPRSPAEWAPSLAASAPGPSAADDPEDYLAGHRWGFLTDALLAGRVDWELELADCVRWVERHPDKADAAWEP